MKEEKKYNGGEQKRTGQHNYKNYLYMGVIALILFLGLNNLIFARTPSTGGFFRGSGSCCAISGTEDSSDELRLIGLNYYVSKYGDDNVDAVVKDFGCHQEIHIYQGELLLKRIGYVNGEVFEL